MKKQLIHQSIHGYRWRFRYLGHVYSGLHHSEPLQAHKSLSDKLLKMSITRNDVQEIPVTRFD